MSFTRFHDDPCRIQKHLQESTGPGKYILNKPGQGARPHFIEDPFIRLEKWGANLTTNSINLESDLRGMTRKLNRDHIDTNDYKGNSAKSKKINYPVSLASTNQSRATHPAWTFKDLEQAKWDFLPVDPQKHTSITFQNNLSTRILEKDNFVPNIPKVN